MSQAETRSGARGPADGWRGSPVRLRKRLVVAGGWVRAHADVLLPALTVATVALGVGAFDAEAAVRGEAMPWHEALYSTLGLFAFAGNRFGYPQTALLASVYFLAPFVTASAVAEVFLRLVESRTSLLMTGLRGHTVICGAGTVGAMLAESADKHGLAAVFINNTEPERGDRHGALLVKGDMLQPRVRARARVAFADAVYVTTADDLLNLEVATELAAERGARAGNGSPRTFCHVDDDALRAALRGAPQQGGAPADIRYFNCYRLAAKALLGRVFARRWLGAVQLGPGAYLRAGTPITRAASPGEDLPAIVMVVGLGRFGCAVLEQLVDLLPSAVTLWAVDLDRRAIARARARVRPGARMIWWEHTEAEDPRWVRKARAVRESALVFLCTDQDRDNLRYATEIGGEVRVVARVFNAGFGEKFTSVSANGGNLMPVGLRELFAEATPLLVHQRALDPAVAGRSGAWIRTCLRETDTGRTGYLVWLTAAEWAALRQSPQEACVLAEDVLGVPPNAPAWTVVSAEALPRLRPADAP